ncbi:MAG: hypothetical protein DMG51_15070 [Acidobacteria bacterium]|nr:MAG: hypothetical protein DMG51_15070 [Acidobacteriota bacterium]
MTFVISERLAVQHKGMNRSLVLLGHLLLSNDLSMVFEVAQEAFMPPAVARLRSELNAIAHTICSM